MVKSVRQPCAFVAFEASSSTLRMPPIPTLGVPSPPHEPSFAACPMPFESQPHLLRPACLLSPCSPCSPARLALPCPALPSLQTAGAATRPSSRTRPSCRACSRRRTCSTCCSNSEAGSRPLAGVFECMVPKHVCLCVKQHKENRMCLSVWVCVCACVCVCVCVCVCTGVCPDVLPPGPHDPLPLPSSQHRPSFPSPPLPPPSQAHHAAQGRGGRLLVRQQSAALLRVAHRRAAAGLQVQAHHRAGAPAGAVRGGGAATEGECASAVCVGWGGAGGKGWAGMVVSQAQNIRGRGRGVLGFGGVLGADVVDRGRFFVRQVKTALL